MHTHTLTNTHTHTHARRILPLKCPFEHPITLAILTPHYEKFAVNWHKKKLNEVNICTVSLNKKSTPMLFVSLSQLQTLFKTFPQFL